MLFALLLGSVKVSYDVFVSPQGYAEVTTLREFVFGFVEMLLGVSVTGFIIAILSVALLGFLARLKSGTTAYARSGHILIVNRNSKLRHILSEINKKHSEICRTVDVVILLKSADAVLALCDDLDFASFPFLTIFPKHGDLYKFAAYEKVAVLKAFGLIVLHDENLHDVAAADIDNLRIFCTLTNNAAFPLWKPRRPSSSRRKTVQMHDRSRRHDQSRRDRPRASALEQGADLRARQSARRHFARDEPLDHGHRVLQNLLPSALVLRPRDLFRVARAL